jgi:hypothetical protein
MGSKGEGGSGTKCAGKAAQSDEEGTPESASRLGSTHGRPDSNGLGGVSSTPKVEQFEQLFDRRYGLLPVNARTGDRFARNEGIDLEELRTRLRKMNDEELIRFGKAARSMCRDKAPRQVFVIQLEEAKAEWRRRYKGAQRGEEDR